MRKVKWWTLKEEQFLKDHYGKMNAKELAVHLDRSVDSVKRKLTAMGIKMPPTIYTVYKGEDVIAEGTAKECADKLKVTKRYIQFIATEIAHRRIDTYADPDNATIAFKRRG